MSEVKTIESSFEEDQKKQQEKVVDKNEHVEDEPTALKPKDMTYEQLVDYNEKLKQENAKRRVKTKKAEESLTAYERQVKEKDEALKAVQEQLAKIQKAEEEKELAEKAEIERLRVQLEKEQQEKESVFSELNKAKTEAQRLAIATNVYKREQAIDRLVSSHGVSFSTDFEKRGFFSDLTATDSDGAFKLNDDEVGLKVSEFVNIKKQVEQQNKAASIPQTPMAGPVGKGAVADTITELKQLMEKSDNGSLSLDERARLSELSRMI